MLLSTDVYTYWDYARISTEHGGNPYVDVPNDYPDDPAFPLMGSHWRDTTSVYGPGFTLASEGHAVVVGGSPDAAAWLYRALAAAAMVALVLLAARLSPQPAFAAAFVGWNPLLAVHFAGGGHNDAWMMAFVLAALALAASGRRGLAGVAWAAAIAIKWVPLLFLPLRFLEARKTGRTLDHRGLAGAAVVIVAIATWRYGFSWIGAAGPLARNFAEDRAWYAIPSRIASVGIPEGAVALGFALAFVGAYAWLLREAWRGRARLALTACFLLICTSWLVPWYAVWAVPLAAVEEDGPRGSSLWRSRRTCCATPSRSSAFGLRYAVVADLISVAEAQRLILERAKPLEAERVPIERATGRVLAAPAAAAVDLPPFPSSAMDGFALRSADTTEAPVTLPVVARIAAGAPAGRPLAPGEAMGIATGGAVPDGADAVVPIEVVEEEADGVTVSAAVAAGTNVRERGGDVKAGETVLDAGVLLGPGQVGALAAAGVAEVRATKRPRVGILVTGSELRQPGEALEAGQIYESNGLLLATALQLAGAVPGAARGGRRHGGRASPDDGEGAARVRHARDDGGASVGPTISCARCRPSFGSRRSSGVLP